MGSVYVVGTGDTKGRELAYLREVIAAQGLPVVVVDVGTTGHASTADITPAQVAAHHPAGADAVVSDDRGAAVGAMAVALEHFAVARVADVAGMIGIGGSGGTAIVAPALRALPIGVPKVLVSTVASGNVAPYVGPADIAMLYSVTDLAGLNRISRVVLGNAANAVAGMVAHPVTPPADARPVVGLTMFGVTTALVTQLVAALEAAWDPLVFHATGTGGQSLEKLVDSGMVARDAGHDHDRGRRPALRRRVPGDRGPARRGDPHRRARTSGPVARSTWRTSARPTRCPSATRAAASTSTTRRSR